MKPFPSRFGAILLTTLAACTMTPAEPEPTWREVEVETASDRVLWKVMLLSAERCGFPLAGGLDPSSGVLLTGWKTNLQPFSKAGDRKRAAVEMEARGPGRWIVRAHVQRQINKALVDPLDPTRAEWEWVADDTVAAEVLLRHVQATFQPELELESGRDPLSGLRSGGSDRPR